MRFNGKMGAIMADNVVNARLCFCIEIVCAVPVVFVLNGPSGILRDRDARERRKRTGEDGREKKSEVVIQLYL